MNQPADAARLVLTNASVYSPGIPFATSVIVDDGIIAWVGDSRALAGHTTSADITVDCHGALITPAFFDAAFVADQPSDGLGAGITNDGAQYCLWHRVNPTTFQQVTAIPLAGTREIEIIGPDSDVRQAAQFATSGTPFALGSAGHPVDYWAWIRRLTHGPEAALSTRAAFNAATRAGWRMIGDPERGTIRPGAPADLNLWMCEALTVHTPDDRVTAWSTDVRSGTPPLPDLADDVPLPQLVGCVIGADYFDWTGLGPASVDNRQGS